MDCPNEVLDALDAVMRYYDTAVEWADNDGHLDLVYEDALKAGKNAHAVLEKYCDPDQT